MNAPVLKERTTTMTMRVIFHRCLLLTAALLALALPLEAQDDTYHVLLEWTGAEPAGLAAGLFFYRGNEGGQTNTILVETPSGKRIVGTERLDVIAGTDTFLVEDDASGWWIEVRKKWPRQWASMSDFFDHGQEDLDEVSRQGEESEVVVRIPDGVVFDGALPVLVPGEDFEALGRALSERTSGDDLGTELPPNLVEALPFLEAVLGQSSSMGSKFGPLVGLLRRQAGLPRSAIDSEVWSENREFRPGLLVKEPAAVELLQRFERTSQAEIMDR